MKRSPLGERFARFLASIDGAESLDAPPLSERMGSGKKADYLLENRTVVLELKQIESDTSHKVEAEVEKHRGRDDFPMFYGERPLGKVLDRLPDGNDINRRIYGLISRSIEDSVRAAEGQITTTRSVLQLEKAAGFLVLLNETVEILNPDAVRYKVDSLMRRKRTGRSSSETLDFVCLIFESHALKHSPKQPTFPILLIPNVGSDSKYPWFDDFFDRFVSAWALFNRARLLHGKPEDIADKKVEATAKLFARQPVSIQRHELWRREYRVRPHLRNLSDGEVLAHTGKTVAALVPYFTGTVKSAPERMMQLMREWTCALEEINFRGLDMRDVPKP